MSLSDRECSESGFLRSDVILNGGEAGVRDLTSAESFDGVDGNASSACSLRDLGYCIAAFGASYGPSEGLRPPQDDMGLNNDMAKRGKS